MNARGFRPDAFFDGEWRGWGVAHDIFGKARDRFVINGSGEIDEKGRRFVLREGYEFDDGRTENLEWTIFTDDQGAFSGSEAHSDAIARGMQDGNDYCWWFDRRTKTALGELKLRLTSKYHPVSENEAICLTDLRLAGVKIATLTVCYRRG